MWHIIFYRLLPHAVLTYFERLLKQIWQIYDFYMLPSSVPVGNCSINWTELALLSLFPTVHPHPPHPTRESIKTVSNDKHSFLTKTTKMEVDQTGRRPKWKTTRLGYNQTGKRPNLKMTKLEDEQTKMSKRKMTWIECNIKSN